MLKLKFENNFQETEIGVIPSEWDIKPLGDALKIKYGRGLPEKDRRDGQIPVFGSSGVVGYHTSALSKGPGLIIGRKGNVGSVYLSKCDFYPIDTVFYCEDVENAAYLYFTLTEINLEQLMSDSAVPGLNIHFLESVKIPYPPLPEQNRISAVLSWFDELIENKIRQNEVLEKVAMAVFKSWFVDFEPFRDGEFVPSELGEIPKGWTVKPIGELAEIRNGLSYSGKEKFEEPVEGGYVFITLNNAIEGGGFKPVYAWIKSDRIKEHHFLEEGDLIIPNTEQTKDERLLGSPGIVFFPPDYKTDKGVYSMDIVRIAPKEKHYKFYLYLYLMFTREESASFHSGTSVLHFDIQNFKKNKLVPCPPTPILEKFHSLLEPLFRKVILNQKQIMVLRKVRDSLLPLLVFGKLRVEEL